MDNLRVETMTLNELVREKRKLGIPCSEETEKAGIIQKVFPYADYIERKQAVFVIYRRLFEEWVSQRANSSTEQVV